MFCSGCYLQVQQLALTMTVQDQCMSGEVAESKRNSDSTGGSEGTSERPVEGSKKEGEEQVAMNNITSIEMETGKKEDGDESDSDCAAAETQPLKVCALQARISLFSCGMCIDIYH